MGYSWFRTDHGGDQKAGFFVDDADRILYWPGKSAPGYVVDEPIADRIIASKYSYNFRMLYPLCAWGAIVIPLMIWVTDSFTQKLTFLFTRAGLGFAIFGGTLLLAAVAMWAFYKFSIRPKTQNKLEELLRAAPQIHEDRPHAHELKPIAYIHIKDGGPFWLSFLALFLIGAFLLYFAAFTDQRIGNRIVLWVFALGVNYLIFLILRRQVIGFHPRDISVLDTQFITPVEKEDDSLPSTKKSKNIGSKIFKAAGWTAVAILTFGILVNIAEYADNQAREPITSEILVSNFFNRVLRPKEHAGDPLRLEKWMGVISIRSNGETNMLREKIDKHLKSYVRYTGLKSVLLQDAKNTQGVTITYLQNFAPQGVEPPASFTYKGWQKGGWLSKVNYKINYDRLVSENISSFSRRSKRVISYTEKLALRIALSVFGLYGNPSLMYPSDYKDKSQEDMPLHPAAIAMLYDPRIKPGMTREELLPIVRVIADEIVNANSFEGWLQQRDAR